MWNPLTPSSLCVFSMCLLSVITNISLLLMQWVIPWNDLHFATQPLILSDCVPFMYQSCAGKEDMRIRGGVVRVLPEGEVLVGEVLRCENREGRRELMANEITSLPVEFCTFLLLFSRGLTSLKHTDTDISYWRDARFMSVWSVE